MSLFRNAATVLATSVAIVPIQLVNGIVLARFLSVDDRGLYGVAMAFGATVALVFEFGWGFASINRLRRVGIPPGRVMGASLTAVVMFSVAAAVLVLPLRDFVRERLLDGASREVVYLALAIVPAQIAWMVFGSIARGLDRFGLENLTHLAMVFLRLLATTLALVVLGGALGAALTAHVATLALGALWLLLVLGRQTGFEQAGPGEIRASLRFAVRAWISRMSARLHDRFDVFMLAWFLAEPSQVAFYTVALTVSAQLKLLPEALGRALYPELASAAELSAGHIAMRALRHSLFWVCGCMLVAAPAAPLLIPKLFGEPYQASVPLFLVLLPGMIFLTSFRIFVNYFAGVGRQRANVQTQLLATVVNVSLNLYLIPRYGALGAAFANVASIGTGAVLLGFAFVRDTRLPIQQALRFRRSDLDPYLRRLAILRRRLQARG